MAQATPEDQAFSVALLAVSDGYMYRPASEAKVAILNACEEHHRQIDDETLNRWAEALENGQAISWTGDDA